MDLKNMILTQLIYDDLPWAAEKSVTRTVTEEPRRKWQQGMDPRIWPRIPVRFQIMEDLAKEPR